jgi:uncharacterized protein
MELRKSKISGAKPKIVFVIDDIGHSRTHEPELKALGDDVTYAVLPMLPHSKYFGQLGHKMGADIILHLPLESKKGTIPGPGLITSQMSQKKIKDLVNRDLDHVPHLIGINNHMGSAGTENSQVMEAILSELKKKRLFFLDSYTTPLTVGPTIAKRLGVPIVIRDVFLDNVDQKESIRKQVRKLSGIARLKGYAIGIGHMRENTLEILKEEIPRLQRQGFEVVRLSEVVRLKA